MRAVLDVLGGVLPRRTFLPAVRGDGGDPMTPSTVSVFGVPRPLREAQIESEQDPLYGPAGDRRWYVGGQSKRSWQTALWALENLLDGPEGYWVDNIVWSGLPCPCASLRHGNCLTFTVTTPEEYAHRLSVFGPCGETEAIR